MRDKPFCPRVIEQMKSILPRLALYTRVYICLWTLWNNSLFYNNSLNVNNL